MRFGLLAPFCASSSIVGFDVATASSAAKPLRTTLRTKGILVLVALLVYAAIVVAVLVQQWNKSLVFAARLEHINIQEQKVELLQSALAHALLEVQAKSFSENPTEALQSLLLDIGPFQQNAEKLAHQYPKLVPVQERVGRDLAELLIAPGREGFVALHQSMNDIGTQISSISEEVHADREQLVNASRRLHNRIAVIGVTMGLLGVVLLGVTMGVFLTRLARHIRKLETHAVGVVTGYRGPPLGVTRRDELGSLMEAVNRMQAELGEREKQIEIARQRRFHHEKMEAMGSLASAVAHEISNPVAAIMGVAQRIIDTKQSHACPRGEADGCHPELILEHTKRIAAITRQIAELTAPQSPEPALLDLNGLVQNTVNFVAYDRRFRGINLALELDHDLPAIRAVADHVTQVLMNLLINAADALEGASGRKPAIRVATRAADGEVEVTVSDNGHGMTQTVLSQVFKESFTTKPQSKGRGLGLSLCKTLIEEDGGRIELESTSRTGTTARIRLPLRHKMEA